MGCICLHKAPPIKIQQSIPEKDPLYETSLITQQTIQFKNCYQKITKENLVNIFQFLNPSELKETRKCYQLFQKLVIQPISERELIKKQTEVHKITFLLPPQSRNNTRRKSLSVLPQRIPDYQVVINDTLVPKNHNELDIGLLLETEMEKHNMKKDDNKQRSKSAFGKNDKDKQSNKTRESPQKSKEKRHLVNQTIKPQNSKMLNLNSIGINQSKTMKIKK